MKRVNKQKWSDMLETMLQQAKQARTNAYAPYSNFAVGACLVTQNDKLFSGCNVENASYGLTCCAETSAICQMISSGEKTIKEILIVGDGKSLITPCGSCRQQIFEFAINADMPVHLCDSQGVQKTLSIGQLLPNAFGPQL